MIPLLILIQCLIKFVFSLAILEYISEIMCSSDPFFSVEAMILAQFLLLIYCEHLRKHKRYWHLYRKRRTDIMIAKYLIDLIHPIVHKNSGDLIDLQLSCLRYDSTK